MMLMGAALMRSGWLKGRSSLRHYRRTGALLVAAGMAVNLPAISPSGIWPGLSLVRVFTAGAAQTQRPAAGYRLCRAGLGYWPQLCRFRLVGAIACVGRMALTNYLLQTLTATTPFYHLGLFMRFDRLQLLAFVPPIWAVNLLVSSLWLRRFRQGRWNGCGVS